MWERRVVDIVLRHRLAVFVVCGLLTAAAAFYAKDLAFDSDIEIWFLEDDASLLTYRKFLEQFQTDEIEVIGVFADDVFTVELLTAIDRITQEVGDAPHVYDVTSVTNAKILSSQGAFHVAIRPLMEKLPDTAEAAAELRRRALDNVLIRGNLVSDDGRAAAIVAELDPAGNTVEGKYQFIDALRGIAARHLPKGVEWHLSGSPTLDEAFFSYTERDFAVLAPAAAVVVLLACLILLRRTRAALAPLSVVTLAALWTFGLMGALGLKLNVVSSSLVALILAVGVADSIHVVSDYYQELMTGKSRDEALAHATAGLIVPCFFTSITTAAGFLSLLVSDLKPVSEFGWLAAVGVSFALVLSITLLPAVLSVIPAPEPSFMGRERSGVVSRLLLRLGRPTLRSSIAVLFISGVLVALAAVGISHVQVGVNPMNYFRPGDPVRVAMARVDSVLGGSGSFDLVVNTKPGGLKEPSVLRRLAELEKRVEALPAVTRVLSVLEGLRETRRLLTDGRPESARLPDTRPMAAQLYIVLEGDEEFRRNVLGDYQTTRMSARVEFSKAKALVAQMPELLSQLREHYWDEELRVEATGYVMLMGEMEGYLLSSQINSLLLAFGVITLMMLLLLRSLSLTLLSMIPNFIPIALGLAFMAPARIALDPGTVMIGGMALGLVVDDTVHFLVRLRRGLDELDLRAAIERSMLQTGRPIIFTSLILAAGFLTLTVGSFSPNVSFGLVSAIVILLALIADLVMLPAALVVFNPRMRRARREREQSY